MSVVKIEPTERSPKIDFDFGANKFKVSGESYPEDVNEFYGPIVEKMEDHLNSLSDAKILFEFELIYFNSSTAKILMGLFDMMDEAAEAGNEVLVNWRYEEDDDNMEELGEEYGEDLEHATFQLVPVSIE